jgi:hypothetical protein
VLPEVTKKENRIVTDQQQQQNLNQAAEEFTNALTESFSACLSK